MNRDLAAGVLALAFGTIAAFVVTAAPLPIWYLPIDGVLVLGEKPHGIVIDYYGRVFGVVVGCGVGATLGFIFAARVSRRVVGLSLAWAALAGVLTVGLSLSQIWNRSLTPISFPPSTPSSTPTSARR